MAIAGGGFTGLWTAYYLARADPTLRIAVLEAAYPGFGASGRNGGWCSGLFPVSSAKLARRYGAGAASAMYRELADTVDEVGRVAAAEGIDCDFAQGGTITLARTPAQLRRARSTSSGTFLDAPAARAICGATSVLGGVYRADCAALQPAKLVRGLAAAVSRLGVSIYEQTRVTSLGRGVVTTTRGTVRASTVVRALEGYTATVPGFRRTLAPVYSLVLATEPLPAPVWDRIGLARRETFTDERHLIIYGQRTADDRLVFGGRGAPYHFGSRIRDTYDQVPAVFAALRATLRDLFDIDPPIAYEWGGPLGIPRDWMPSVGLSADLADGVSHGLADGLPDRVANGLVEGVSNGLVDGGANGLIDGVAWAGGYVGDGVAAANLAGRTLTDLITGKDSDLTHLPWVGHRSRRWEPEPVRWLGINAALRAVQVRDAWERR